MNLTWVSFRWVGGKWVFAGLTEHDEKVTEFEEVCEETGTPHRTFALEDPTLEEIRAMEPPEEEDVQVKGDLL